jgi:hypothetical protein
VGYPSVHNRAERPIEENPSYAYSKAMFVVSRELLIYAATHGVGTVARGRHACLLVRSARIADAVLTAREWYNAARSGYGAYQAYQRGDWLGVFTNSVGAGLGGLGAAGGMARIRSGIMAGRGQTGSWLSGIAQYLKTCFAAGTPLLTPEGDRRSRTSGPAIGSWRRPRTTPTPCRCPGKWRRCSRTTPRF